MTSDNEGNDSPEVDRSESRISAPELDPILGQPFKVLDHGFVRVIDYMGSDSSIVQAARVSYGKGTRQAHDDTGLIRYLLRHSHSTPFEMCEIKLHVKLPIFVARQWIRHRTANVNEYSARYSIIDNEFYVPDQNTIASQSNSNKQGRGSVLSDEESRAVMSTIRSEAMRSYATYETLLGKSGQNEGVARELARIGLGLNFYTQWYWKIDLHNLFRFLLLRADSHAQYEIRQYAETILDIVRRWVPIAHQAFLDYQLNAISLSVQAVFLLRKRLAGESISFADSKLSKREWEELSQIFDL